MPPVPPPAMSGSPHPLENMCVMLAVDQSASMLTRDVRGQSRLAAIQEGTMALCYKMLSVNPGGIELYSFGRGARRVAGRVGPGEVAELFGRLSLESRTDTHDLIRLVAEDRDRSKSTLLIVATDGAPTDPRATRDAIVEAAATCTPSARNPGDTDDFTILFYQVGADHGATEFLRELDDDLVKRYGARFDIVDAKTADQIDGRDPFEVAMQALED